MILDVGETLNTVLNGQAPIVSRALALIEFVAAVGSCTGAAKPKGTSLRIRAPSPFMSSVTMFSTLKMLKEQVTTERDAASRASAVRAIDALVGMNFLIETPYRLSSLQRLMSQSAILTTTRYNDELITSISYILRAKLILERRNTSPVSLSHTVDEVLHLRATHLRESVHEQAWNANMPASDNAIRTNLARFKPVYSLMYTMTFLSIATELTGINKVSYFKVACRKAADDNELGRFLAAHNAVCDLFDQSGIQCTRILDVPPMPIPTLRSDVLLDHLL